MTILAAQKRHYHLAGALVGRAIRSAGAVPDVGTAAAPRWQRFLAAPGLRGQHRGLLHLND